MQQQRRRAPEQRQIYRSTAAAPRRRRRNPKRWAVPVVALLLMVFATSMVFYGVKALVSNDEGGTTGGAVPYTGAPVKAGLPVVLLDAGHGGSDNGATNAAETIFEQDITLDMALRVGELLARHEGELQVAYTRTDGSSYISPKERGQMSAAVGADLLLSLHINADEYSTSGFQVFAQPPRNTYNAQSLALSEAITANIPALGLDLLGGNGIYYMFYRTAEDKQGYNITWDIPDEELANDTFGVLQHASCPAVLAEMWFISSTADMNRMYNEAGKAAMAQALYQGVCSYLGITPIAAV